MCSTKTHTTKRDKRPPHGRVFRAVVSGVRIRRRCASPRCFAPSTVRPLARDPRVLIDWPLPLGFGLDGRLLLATGTAWAGLC